MNKKSNLLKTTIFIRVYRSEIKWLFDGKRLVYVDPDSGKYYVKYRGKLLQIHSPAVGKTYVSLSGTGELM